MCPHCQGALNKTEILNDHLEGKRCQVCGGIWIPGYNYAHYLERWSPNLPDSNRKSSLNPTGTDSASGKDCPDCGKALIARKVGQGLAFHVERCGHCFGIWLDQGEWEGLTSKGLEDKLNDVFSAYWQARVREETQEGLREAALEKLLGEDRATIVVQFKRWLAQQPERDDIARYL